MTFFLIDDDASNFSELADSSFSPSNSLTSSTDIQVVCNQIAHFQTKFAKSEEYEDDVCVLLEKSK